MRIASNSSFVNLSSLSSNTYEMNFKFYTKDYDIWSNPYSKEFTITDRPVAYLDEYPTGDFVELR